MDSRSVKEGGVLARIGSIEADLAKAREYLASGRHADWHGFRALFEQKHREDRELPPYKDSARNVFVRRLESDLSKAERALERLAARRERRDEARDRKSRRESGGRSTTQT
ncbi:MAG: hypothetical protein AAF196_18705 [Planctomycetota bacterium]